LLNTIGCTTLASTDLYYLDYPDPQSFQIGTPMSVATCTYDLALVINDGGNDV